MMLKSILGLIMLVASTRAEVTCDECKTAVENLQAHLLTDESIAAQIGLLVEALCPGAPDPALCETFFTGHWVLVAQAAYPFLLVGEPMCQALESCPMKGQPEVREWTCDDCTNGIAAIANILSLEETALAVAEYLKGDAFCGRPDDHMPEDCPGAVDIIVAPSMQVLAAYAGSSAAHLCNEVVQEGLCPE